MNAVLDIQVRVAAREAAAALKVIEAQVKAVNRAAASGSANAGFLTGFGDQMVKTGKNVQWTGRQLTQNFTLPLVLAGAAATKFAFDNEKAMAQVKKVYNRPPGGIAAFNAEIKELDRSMEMLSNRFGKSKAEITEIAAAWAEAGASGRGLQRSVRQTLDVMILGGMESTAATQGLIAIQAQYGASTTKLIRIVDALNAVENEVPVTLKGLIDGFSRAAGSARAAGIDYQGLAGMLAAITPAAGSATTAGNGIRSILTRLAKPTKETTEAFEALGLSLRELKAVNGQRQLEMISDALARYTRANGDANKLTIASAIAGTYQVNRFVTLMDAIQNKQSAYYRAQTAASDADSNRERRLRELNTALGTNAHHFDMMIQVIKNEFTKAFQPLLPVLFTFLRAIVGITRWFAKLSPEAQRIVMYSALLLALIGPLVQYYGAWKILIGEVAKGIGFLVNIIFGKIAATTTDTVATEANNAATRRQGGLIGLLTDRYKALGPHTAKASDMVRQALLRMGTAMQTFFTPMMQGFQLAAQSIYSTFILPVVQGVRLVAASMVASMSAAYQQIAIGSSMMLAPFRKVWTMIVLGFTWAAQDSVLMWSRAYQQITIGATLMLAPFRKVWTMIVLGFTWAAQDSVLMWSRAYQQMVVGATLMLVPFRKVWTMIVIGFGMAAQNTALTWSRAYQQMVVGAMLASSQVKVAVARMALWAALAASGAGAAIISAAQATAAGLGSVAASAAAALTSPVWATVAIVVLALAAIGLAINHFYEGGIKKFVQDVAHALGQLPRVFVNVFNAIGRFLAGAIRQIVDTLSYLNPFARHSPSMVDNVTNGVTAILSQYARLRGIPSLLSSAVSALKAFNKASAGGLAQAREGDRNEQRKAVGSFAPEALDELNNMYRAIDALESGVGELSDEIRRQEAIVESWELALDSANLTLKDTQNELERLEEIADRLGEQLSEAKDRFDAWARTPIEGMQAMSDAIFENQQAQKRMRLEMMAIEDAIGPIDEVRDKLNSLAGDIEMARGQQAELRAAGAGSDVLSVWDDQIAQMEEARSELQNATQGRFAAMKALQKEMDKLQRQGERLDLENSLKFDGLTRQIENAAEAMAEMPFDVILAGVKAERAEVTRLQAAYDDATAAVKLQEAAVKVATENRDAIQKVYDVEQEKLSKLKDAYSEVTDQIRAMEDAIQQFATAASSASRGAEESLFGTNLAAGQGADLPDLGKMEGIDREGFLKEMQQFNDQMKKDMEKALGEISEIKIDIFKPVKDAWNKGWAWFKEKAGLFPKDMAGSMSQQEFDKAFGDIQPFKKLANNAQKDVAKMFDSIAHAMNSSFLNNGVITDKEAASLSGKVNKFHDKIVASTNDMTDKRIKAIRNLAAQTGGIMGAEGEQMVEILLKKRDDAVRITGEQRDGVLKKIEELRASGVNVTSEMVNEMLGQLGKMRDTSVSVLNDKKSKQLAILDSLKYQTGVLSKEDTDQIIKEANRARDDVIKSATDTRNGRITEARKMLEAGVITKAQFEDEVRAANEARDKAVGAATDRRDKTIARAREMSDGIKGAYKDIDQSNKDVGFSFEQSFDAIQKVSGRFWNTLVSGFRNGVNMIIDFMNDIGDAIKAVGKAIGVNLGDWRLKRIPEPSSEGGGSRGSIPVAYRASGGMIPVNTERGGVWGRPRAVIGEGNPSYPEYVIPTDPKYRERAKMLQDRVAKAIGQGRTNQMASGGIIPAEAGGVGDFVKDKASDAAGLFRKGAAMAAFAPFLKVADTLIGRLPGEFIQKIANDVKNKVYNWVKGVDSKGIDASTPVASPARGTLPGGGSSVDRLIGLMRSSGVPHRVTSTMRPGDKGYHGQNRAVDFAGPKPGRDTKELGRIFYAFKNIESDLKELIYAGPQVTYNIKNGKRVGKYAQSGHHDHVHAALANGGVVSRSANGTLARLGEGRHDELVTPLPPGFMRLMTLAAGLDLTSVRNGLQGDKVRNATVIINAGAGTTATSSAGAGGVVVNVKVDRGDDSGRQIVFNGDLTFPNIKTGDDAEKFIRNLEALAG